MSKNGYTGKIAHGGAQVVKAPYAAGGKAKGGKVVRGDDLRSGIRSGKDKQ